MQQKRRETDDNNGAVLVVHKYPGETMGQLIMRIRSLHLIPEEAKVTFAGRLDPLASGLVLLLWGEKRFEKNAFLVLPKAYSFNLVFDVTTDTLDVLGKVTGMDAHKNGASLQETQCALKNVLPTFIGTHEQSYPHYSSKTVRGIPLFEYARKHLKVKIPTKRIDIYSLSLNSVVEKSKGDFLSELEKNIRAVVGDFRQEEIYEEWKERSKDFPEVFHVARFTVECSSGTYVRVLAEQIAQKVGRRGIADSIIRLRIGEFTKALSIV